MKKNELNNTWIKLFLFLLGFVVILSGFVAGLDDSKKDNTKVKKVNQTNIATKSLPN